MINGQPHSSRLLASGQVRVWKTDFDLQVFPISVSLHYPRVLPLPRLADWLGSYRELSTGIATGVSFQESLGKKNLPARCPDDDVTVRGTKSFVWKGRRTSAQA